MDENYYKYSVLHCNFDFFAGIDFNEKNGLKMKQATSSLRKIQSGTVNSHMVNHPSLLSLINQS